MCTGFEWALLAMSAGSAAVSYSQAQQAEKQAKDNAEASYRSAKANTEAQYAETNRKIAEENLAAMEEKSDMIRAANEALGTLRATETALSDSTLGTIYFENYYGEALNYTRVDESVRRANLALESEKYGAEQSYITKTTLAQNEATNMIRESNARKVNALTTFASGSLQIGAGYVKDQQTLDALQNKPVRSTSQILFE